MLSVDADGSFSIGLEKMGLSFKSTALGNTGIENPFDINFEDSSDSNKLTIDTQGETEVHGGLGGVIELDFLDVKTKMEMLVMAGFILQGDAEVDLYPFDNSHEPHIEEGACVRIDGEILVGVHAKEKVDLGWFGVKKKSQTAGFDYDFVGDNFGTGNCQSPKSKKAKEMVETISDHIEYSTVSELTPKKE